MTMVYGVPQEQDWNALADDAFRAHLRDYFEAHFPRELRFAPNRLHWPLLRPWYRHMAEKGWIAPAWPREFGGMGLSQAKLLIFLEEQERCGVVRYQDHGVLMIGPLLMRYGTPEQQRRWLPPILACEHIWCQGYSEPGAGSDLAGLRTRADRQADGSFVVNGQKTWTTLAMDATHLFLLARTDPAARKQQGISFLLTDITAPGIRLRPIRDIAGHEEFCEVFLDDVHIPADGLLGRLNDGWTIAKSLLGFERIALGSPKFCEYALRMLLRTARLRGQADDPVFRDRLSALQLDVAHLADAYAGFAAQLVAGQPIGPDVSLLKIWSTETFQRIVELTLEVAGDAAALAGEVPLGDGRVNVVGPWHKARPSTIYGGSNEIQRNIVAQHVLGLPRGAVA